MVRKKNPRTEIEVLSFYEEIKKYRKEREQLFSDLNSHFVVLYGDAKYQYGTIGKIKSRLTIYPNSEHEQNWKFLYFLESFDKLRLFDDNLSVEGVETIEALEEFYEHWESFDLNDDKEREEAEKLIDTGEKMISASAARRTMISKQISSIAVELFGNPTDIEVFEGRAGFLQNMLIAKDTPYRFIKDAQDVAFALVKLYDYHKSYMEIFELDDQVIKILIEIINKEIGMLREDIEIEEERIRKEEALVEEKAEKDKMKKLEMEKRQKEIEELTEYRYKNRLCLYCGKPLIKKKADAKFCDDVHKAAFHKNKIIMTPYQIRI